MGCSRNTAGRRLARSAALPLTVAAALIAAPAQAQSAADFDELRREVAALKAHREADAARIAQLEAALASPPMVVQADASRAALAGPFAPAAPVNPAGGSSPTASAPSASALTAPGRLDLSGDVRLRYEANAGDRDGPNRTREVLRARLRASYSVNDWLAVGGQIATGDPDDPNSSDITLGNFADDLTVSLDQAYARLSLGKFQAYLGKFPQPFARTELVWDGDVSPQGISAAYTVGTGGGSSFKAVGVYFVVDEQVAGPDSDMIGGQLQFETIAAAPLKLELAAGYYDYRLRSQAGSDAGDLRTNRLVNGRYLHDFDMLDVIAAVTASGLHEKWPVRLVANYVRNFGAPADEGTGYGVDLAVGRAHDRGDVRFGYGYAEAAVDAVLAAFSHDNTDLGTNYRQHTLLADYVVASGIIVNGTLYRFRPRSPLFTTAALPDDWVNRFRLNLLISF